MKSLFKTLIDKSTIFKTIFENFIPALFFKKYEFNEEGNKYFIFVLQNKVIRFVLGEYGITDFDKINELKWVNLFESK
jgi:hypothetical protein